MKDNVFVSTNAFKTRDLPTILNICEAERITNLELSSGVAFATYSRETLLAAPEGMRFLVHNYFPPEETGLVLNLASADPGIRRATLEFCKRAVDLSLELGSSMYSVHSGFCYDPPPERLGRYQADLPRQPRDRAETHFRGALRELLDYARSAGVTLCIENNVVPAFNLIDGKNEIDLMSSPDDYRAFMAIDSLRDVKFLLDFGHLNVSAGAEGFDREEFIRLVADRVEAIHLTGNDGATDQHRAFDESEWFIPFLKRFSDRVFTLEPSGLAPGEIHRCVRVVEEAIS